MTSTTHVACPECDQLMIRHYDELSIEASERGMGGREAHDWLEFQMGDACEACEAACQHSTLSDHDKLYMASSGLLGDL